MNDIINNHPDNQLNNYPNNQPDNQPIIQPENSAPQKPGVCIPWENIGPQLGTIQGDEELVKQIWEQNDREAYLFYWQCVLSF